MQSTQPVEYLSLLNLIVVNANDITTDTLSVSGDLFVGGNFHVDGDIDIHGTIEFHLNPVLLSGIPNSALYLDASKQIQSAPLLDGEILIGSSSGIPQSANITATVNQTTVTNGANSIAIGTVQDIAITSDVQFNSLTITTDINASGNITANDGHFFTGTIDTDLSIGSLTTTNTLLVNSTSNLIGDVITGADLSVGDELTVNSLTASMPIKTDVSKKLVSSLISLASDVSGILPIANGGTNANTALTNGKFMVSSGGAIVEGTSSTSPSFSGTVTVGDLIDSGLTNSMPVKTNGSKQLVSSLISLTSDITNILPIANGGTNSNTSLTNTKIMVSSAGSIIEGTSSTAPSFSGTATVGNLIDSGLTNNTLIYANSSKTLSSLALTNGQLAIGSTGNIPVAGSIAGTTNQIIVSLGSGTITLSLPQNINTSASPTFASLNLSPTSIVPNDTASIGSTIVLPPLTSDLATLALFETLSNKTLTAPIINGGTINGVSISLDDIGTLFNLILSSNSSCTANRTLTFDVMDSNRLLQMGGDLSLGSDLSTNGAITLNTSGSTVATIPTGTVTLCDLGTAQTISAQKTFGSVMIPLSTNTIDFGTTSLRWKDFYMTGRINNAACIRIGESAGGTTTTTSNTFIGLSAGSAVLTGVFGAQNTAVGFQALLGTTGTTSDNCTAIGANALRFITTGSENTAVGQNALTGLTTGIQCTGVGYQCGNNGCGDNSTFLGYRTGIQCASTSGCTYVGSGAGMGTSSGGASGVQNTAVGNFSMGGSSVLSSGARNTTVGYGTANRVTTGLDNVIIGWGAGGNLGTAGPTAITTGGQNILIGSDAGVNSASASNRIAIGYGVVTNTDNVCKIGNSSCTNILTSSDNTTDLGNITTRFKSLFCVDTRFGGTTRNLILTASQPATASRTVTIPDPGANCNVIISETAQTKNGLLTLGNGAQFTNATSGYSATTLDYFEETSIAYTLSGIWATGQAITCYVGRIGKTVSLTFTGSAATANTSAVISFNTTMLTRFRPVDQIVQIISVRNNGAVAVGSFIIQADGTMNIYNTNSSNFTGSGTSGNFQFAITYRSA